MSGHSHSWGPGAALGDASYLPPWSASPRQLKGEDGKSGAVSLCDTESQAGNGSKIQVADNTYNVLGVFFPYSGFQKHRCRSF